MGKTKSLVGQQKNSTFLRAFAWRTRGRSVQFPGVEVLEIVSPGPLLQWEIRGRITMYAERALLPAPGSLLRCRRDPKVFATSSAGERDSLVLLAPPLLHVVEGLVLELSGIMRSAFSRIVHRSVITR